MSYTHDENCKNCGEKFEIEAYQSGNCTKCGLKHTFIDDDYLPYPEDMVTVNLKNAPELLEGWEWYPVRAKSNSEEVKGVFQYSCGRFICDMSFGDFGVEDCLWIGAKIQFPEDKK